MEYQLVSESEADLSKKHSVESPMAKLEKRTRPKKPQPVRRIWDMGISYAFNVLSFTKSFKEKSLAIKLPSQILVLLSWIFDQCKWTFLVVKVEVDRFFDLSVQLADIMAFAQQIAGGIEQVFPCLSRRNECDWLRSASCAHPSMPINSLDDMDFTSQKETAVLV